MRLFTRTAEWLEAHICTPAYSGWILGAIAMCFFGAATNTMVGWLYVISGVSFALLGVAAIIPARALKPLRVHRRPISPVSAGDYLTLELEIENPARQAQTLLQVRDLLPYVLSSQPAQTAIEVIAPGKSYRWVYSCATQQRGVYRWYEVQLRTGTPLGLFWSRRTRQVPAKAIVYPVVLPLKRCSLVDPIGPKESQQLGRDRYLQATTVGLTRGLRPYRYGDPPRLIHWRTSARYGELRLRELEVSTGSQAIIIGLDSAALWQASDFEAAVTAAASLYFYACRRQLPTQLWTAQTGLMSGDRVVLETLAAVQSEEEMIHPLPCVPLVWLTANANRLNLLTAGSRWLLFQSANSSETRPMLEANSPGVVINREQPLRPQLES